jgi:flagellar hook-associated protein 2
MSFGFLSSTSANANNPFRQLIDSLMEQERVRQRDIEQNIRTERSFSGAINTVSSNLSELDSLLRSFELGNGSIFNSVAAESTDESVLTATTSEFFREKGSFDINVDQIARADTRLSDLITDASGTKIADKVTDSETNRTFTVSFPGATEDAPKESVSITLDPLEGRTDREILREIADKLNAQAGQNLTASLISEREGSLRLRVRSDETGEAARLQFSSERNPGEKSIATFLGLTNQLGEDNDKISRNGQPGRLYEVDQLNARFSIDGIAFERASNQVEDVLPGLSLDIRRATEDEPVTLQINTRLEDSVATVQNFIDTYNTVVTDIRSKSAINPETGSRGVLASDRTFANLSFSLRNRVLQSVDTGSEIRTLLDIGLDFQENGTLFISNQTQLEEALTNNLEGVKQLFVDEDNGIISSMRNELDVFLRSETGVITTARRASESRLNTLENRLDSEQNFLRRRENLLTQQFLELERLSNEVQNQFSAFSSFLGG